MDPVRQVADAVLYEGYLLWPYRRSALKNRQRWTFGGVYPEAHARASGGPDASVMQTECLLEADAGARVDVCVRFLHVVERRVARVAGTTLEPVDELAVGGERYLAWDEATEREVVVPPFDPTAAPPPRVAIDVPAGEAVERLRAADGPGGALVRRWEALRGAVEVASAPRGGRLRRLGVRIANATPWTGGPRDALIRRTLVAAHTILRVAGGRFVSLMDPPPALREEAAACRNVGTWPVLAGAEGDRHAMLSSPIILYDWPRVAPESPGDLFDATEIDQLLVLNVLALTEEEQAEMRASDPRARAILERCAGLTEDDRMRLHGAIRALRPLRDGGWTSGRT
ncbi:MAG TPA: hypothetical protein VFD84_02710 [Candidatus Binatia bacterium]|jgi:hydrogenase maturation protease|nr:hypothetical protein [Candidatus Binatia bacterium]